MNPEQTRLSVETFDLIERALAFHLVYARQLVEDLTHEQMCSVPGPGHENHPAFTLGHLCTGADMTAEDVGMKRDLPAGWQDLFERRGPNDRRLPDAASADYPKKTELLAELERQHARIVDGLRRTTSERFGSLTKWRLGRWLPTQLDALLFMCVSHESMHLGQLAAWRRAMGLPAAMASLPAM
ncbi:MAG: DinB family protein [Phycisphaerales bacterium]|nr:DinB family protein [Phycisphaerales bacterium]